MADPDRYDAMAAKLWHEPIDLEDTRPLYEIMKIRIAAALREAAAAAPPVSAWTTEPPKVPGWYWWKNPPYFPGVRPVKLEMSCRYNRMTQDGDPTYLDSPAGEWQGPIEPK